MAKRENRKADKSALPAALGELDKAAFISTARHDLRSPLTAILGFAQSMDEQIFGPLGHKKYQDYVSNIVDAGHPINNMLGTVFDILDADNRSLSLRESEFDIGELVEKSALKCSAAAEDWGVGLDVEVEEGLPLFLGDRDRMLPALGGIFDNGLRYTPAKGTVKISLRLNQAGDIICAIEDNGPGLSDEEIALAVRPFSRVAGVAAHGKQGPGLGLAFAAAVMKAHDGELRVTSKAGQGTLIEAVFVHAVWCRTGHKIL
ncbi:MAG: HAMP domain-containing histidine kinase [Rhodospirillales bacterium]|nr:HAMP domain-containing histidine kinase [Rhodospirillales bacterium]